MASSAVPPVSTSSRKLQPLEGKLVEVHSLAGAELQGTSVRDGDAAEVIAVVLEDGERGRCVAWAESDKQYIVETFSGYLVGVSEANLREFTPPGAEEEGGFDLVWPSGAYPSALFGHMICDHLRAKGYCLVQTFLSEEDRKDVLSTAEEQPEFFRFKAELEDGYLGFNNETKVATMDHDAPDSEPTDAMGRCVRQMTVTGLLLSSVTNSAFGLEIRSETNPMVRLPIAEEEAAAYGKYELTEDDVEEGYVEQFVRFCHQRSISLLYMVDNEGGTVRLYPQDRVETGYAPATVPLSKNKLLIFRNDIMQYSYQPQGQSVALQTWLMSKDMIADDKQAIRISDDFTLAKMGVPGPGHPSGDPAKVMSFMVRYPIGWGNEEYWCAFTMCTDGCRQHPIGRWDHEIYCEEGDMAVAKGKSYTKHGGFLDDTVLIAFDSKQFGYTERQAEMIAPGPRMLLETGYQALIMAGHTKEEVNGKPIGVWVGDVGSDWHSIDWYWPAWVGAKGKEVDEAAMGVSPSMAHYRLVQFLNLTGPAGSFDTACSASLVATATAHEKMQHPNTPCPQNICAGWNTLMAPFSFIGNCMGNMLTHGGRSFTFDRSADGYQRGEGCSAFFIDIADSEEVQRGKIVDLVGSAINQDGRSATITAPNGPAQQECIKRSMRLAGLEAKNINISECHGTGTALGDPIECGALRGVMKGQREFPLLLCSTKSNFGHLEAGAGAAGLTKCMIMIVYATGPPNCHLKALNPHLDISGYPVLFDTEIGDSGYSELDVGVSSFGYGGCNARCDVFGQARGGQNFAVDVQLPYQSYYNRFMPGMALRPFIVKEEGASEEMRDEGGGVYEVDLTFGESGVERFSIRLDDDPMQTLYPIVDNGDLRTPIIGPDEFCKDKLFKVEGEGSVTYVLRFELANGKKALSLDLKRERIADVDPDGE